MLIVRTAMIWDYHLDERACSL